MDLKIRKGQGWFDMKTNGNPINVLQIIQPFTSGVNFLEYWGGLSTSLSYTGHLFVHARHSHRKQGWTSLSPIMSSSLQYILSGRLKLKQCYMQIICTSYEHDMYLICVWYGHDVLICPWYSLDMHLICTWCALYMYLIYTLMNIRLNLVWNVQAYVVVVEFRVHVQSHLLGLVILVRSLTIFSSKMKWLILMSGAKNMWFRILLS